MTGKTQPHLNHAQAGTFHSREEGQLSQIALQSAHECRDLVKEAAPQLLVEDAQFRAAARKGIAQANRGEFIEEAEMEARVKRIFSS